MPTTWDILTEYFFLCALSGLGLFLMVAFVVFLEKILNVFYGGTGND